MIAPPCCDVIYIYKENTGVADTRNYAISIASGDYITFIDNGRIILQKPKDEMLEEYMIIKGDYGNLTEQQKKYLIGVGNKNYGFESLIESNNAQNFDGQFVFEKPNVSQIMLHTIKEGRM